MPLVAFPCGSPSMSSVRCSATDRLAARFTAVVVLPTPPFWLAMAMMRATGYGSGKRTGAGNIEGATPRCAAPKSALNAPYSGVPRDTLDRVENVSRGTIRMVCDECSTEVIKPSADQSFISELFRRPAGTDSIVSVAFFGSLDRHRPLGFTRRR